MYKVDLHTHSSTSPDGGISRSQFKKALQNELLDCIAITDHNKISFALELHKELGDRIIIGEEIETLDGEIIGLFLKRRIKPGQTALATVKSIKEQGGLVYIPHPFETVRKGISEQVLNKIAMHVDVIEVHNARAVFQNKGPQAVKWASINKTAKAVASDAHGLKGLGHTYCKLDEMPNINNLLDLLNNHCRFATKRPPLRTLLYPKLNRVRKMISS